MTMMRSSARTKASTRDPRREISYSRQRVQLRADGVDVVRSRAVVWSQAMASVQARTCSCSVDAQRRMEAAWS
jgi:hypothetical protein